MAASSKRPRTAAAPLLEPGNPNLQWKIFLQQEELRRCPHLLPTAPLQRPVRAVDSAEGERAFRTPAEAWGSRVQALPAVKGQEKRPALSDRQVRAVKAAFQWDGPPSDQAAVSELLQDLGYVCSEAECRWLFEELRQQSRGGPQEVSSGGGTSRRGASAPVLRATREDKRAEVSSTPMENPSVAPPAILRDPWLLATAAHILCRPSPAEPQVLTTAVRPSPGVLKIFLYRRNPVHLGTVLLGCAPEDFRVTIPSPSPEDTAPEERRAGDGRGKEVAATLRWERREMTVRPDHIPGRAFPRREPAFAIRRATDGWDTGFEIFSGVREPYAVAQLIECNGDSGVGTGAA
eukprot:RCo044759